MSDNSQLLPLAAFSLKFFSSFVAGRLNIGLNCSTGMKCDAVKGMAGKNCVSSTRRGVKFDTLLSASIMFYLSLLSAITLHAYDMQIFILFSLFCLFCQRLSSTLKSAALSAELIWLTCVQSGFFHCFLYYPFFINY